MQNLEHVISHVLLIYTLNVTVEQLHYMLVSHSHVVGDKIRVFFCSHSRAQLERFGERATECVFISCATHLPLVCSGQNVKKVFIIVLTFPKLVQPLFLSGVCE